MKKHLCCCLLVILINVLVISAGKEAPAPVIPGIEVLAGKQASLIAGKRVGLITNQSGVDRQGRYDIDLIRAIPSVQLVALFAPEHGIRGQAQAGEKISSSVDAATGIPVYSLYGERWAPTPEMLQDVDVLVYDLQDVGLRYYTYIFTLGECMKAASKRHLPFIVLDRPDPLTGRVLEGRMLEPRLIGLASPCDLPARYGLTPGELAQMIKAELKLELDLHVVKMENWRRTQWYTETGLAWIPPSPNLPTFETALMYAGTCLLEGTNISEGRGTKQPFLTLGAPWINGEKLAGRMNGWHLPGVRFQAASFSPAFSKYAGQACQGVQIDVYDRELCRPLQTALALIQTVRQMWPEKFRWYEKSFDSLAGGSQVRLNMVQGVSSKKIVASWQKELELFRQKSKQYWLYP